MDMPISGEIVPGMDLAKGSSHSENFSISSNNLDSFLSEVPLADTAATLPSDTSTTDPTVIPSTPSLPLVNVPIPCLPMEGGIYEGGEYRYRGVDLSTLEVTPAESILLPLVHRSMIEALYWAEKRNPTCKFPQTTLVDSLRNTMRYIGLVKSENLLDLLYQNGVHVLFILL